MIKQNSLDNDNKNDIFEKEPLKSNNSEKMGKQHQKLWIVLGSTSLLLLSGSMIWLFTPFKSMFSQSNALNTAQTKKQEAINILPVETIKVTPVDTYEEYRTYTGTIVASRISELGFDRPGKIIKILVEEGDKVKAGEPLATLDTANLKAEQQQLLAQKAQLMAQLGEMEAGPRPETIAAARATVKELEEQLELARLKSKRREELYAQGAISREQLDEATFATTGLLARLEEAKSNFAEVLAGTRSEQIEAQKALIAQTDAGLANLQIELEKTILKAPFSGTISARKLDEGSVLSGAGVGQPVLRLVEDGLMEGRIGLPVAATAQIEIDSYQQLKIGEKIYPAQVKAILPELDNQTRTLTVVYTLPGWATEQVYPGQVAQLRLTETIPTAGYWLPTTALVRGVRGLWSCYVLAEKAELEYVPTDGENVFQIEQRYIEVLYTKNDQVLVRGTLQPGDQVILNGTHRLVPQQLVQPVEQKQLIIP